MSSPAPIETEAKYRLVDAATGTRYLVLDSLGEFRASSAPRTTQHEDRYLDTPDRALERAGYVARLRQSPTGTLVTVKSLARSDAGGPIHRRDELEGPADRSADPGSWPPSQARSLILELCGDAPLVELVTVRQLRRRRDYRAEQAAIELSVDEVDVVVHGSVIDRFAEMEIELREGDEGPLQALANLLALDPELTVSDGSKFESALDAARRVRDGRDVPSAHVARGARVQPGPAASAAPDTRTGDAGDASEAEPVLRAASTAAADEAPSTAPSGPIAVPGYPVPAPPIDTEARPEPMVGGVNDGSKPAAEAGAATSDRPLVEVTEVVGTERADEAAEVELQPEEPEGEHRHAEAEDEAEPGEPEGGAEPGEPEGGAEPGEPEGEAEPGRRRLKLSTGKTPGVQSEDSVAEAGRKVLRFHFARMLAKEEGTRDGRNIEDLHQMRVATRRMRAAWRVFGGAYRPDKTRRMRQRLRSVARDLGAVRDLDVLIEGLEGYRSELPAADRRALDPLVSEWHARRERARAVLVAELDSDAYSRFVDEFRAFVETEGAAVRPVGPTEPHRIRDTTPSRIWLAYEQVRAYEPVLRWADVPTLHELRIAAKWLRYTMEFVRETLGSEGGPLIQKVVALQDHLGLLHDADVSAALAREFLVDHAGLLTEAEEGATARYLISRERELARLRRTVGPVWRGVAGLHFRRALGRTTALL